MKKILTTIIMFMLLPVAVQGQNPVRISTDTLPCGVRQPNYYYSAWYDTTGWYLLPDDNQIWHARSVYFDGDSDPVTVQQYAPHPIRARGLWVMVSQYAVHPDDRNGYGWHAILDSTRLPEYLYLYVPRNEGTTVDDDPYFLRRIATVRWDTAQPKMMCVQRTADGRYPNMYCHVYEALFDTVHTLQGEYWIGASMNNPLDSWETGQYPSYQHFPSIYLSIISGGIDYTRVTYCGGSYGRPDGPWLWRDAMWIYGPYGVITDGQRYVEVSSSDTSQGLGLYTAYYTDSTYQTITARAMSCYRFSHWNDSVTDNPRTIYVTSDTSFTAYFEPAPIHDVMVRSGDEVMGQATRLVRRNVRPGDLIPGDQDPEYIRVEGDSAYCAGDEAIFRAVANDGYVFCRWSNGSSDNPLAITVSSDTLLTAYFAPEGVHMVKALSNNDGAGHVSGAGRYPNCDTAWLTAVVDDNEYQFRHWSGGSTENPLAVVSATDTLLTAYFTTRVLYRVDAQSVDETMGHVEGSGAYYEGDEAVIEAVAHPGNHFARWNDSVTTNPRAVVVVQDTSFTAVFESGPLGVSGAGEAGVEFRLVPNPAREQVAVTLAEGATDVTILTLADAAGREVLRKELAQDTRRYVFSVADLPAGTYFVTLATPAVSSTKKLVVE